MSRFLTVTQPRRTMCEIKAAGSKTRGMFDPTDDLILEGLPIREYISYQLSRVPDEAFDARWKSIWEKTPARTCRFCQKSIRCFAEARERSEDWEGRNCHAQCWARYNHITLVPLESESADQAPAELGAEVPEDFRVRIDRDMTGPVLYDQAAGIVRTLLYDTTPDPAQKHAFWFELCLDDDEGFVLDYCFEADPLCESEEHEWLLYQPMRLPAPEACACACACGPSHEAP